MLRPLFLAIGLLFCTAVVVGQTAPSESGKRLVVGMQPPVSDTGRIIALLQTGDYYIMKPGTFANDLDSAFAFFTRAKELSETLQDVKWQNETMAHFGNYYYEKDDRERGKSSYMKVIDYYKKINNKAEEKRYQDRLNAITGGRNSGLIPDNIQYFEAGSLGLQSNSDMLQRIATHKDTAYAYIKAAKLDLAERELLEMLAAYRSMHYTKLQDIYELLAEVSKLESDLHKELYYKLELIKNMEATGDTARADYFYSKLALTYADLNMHDQSQVWILKAMKVLQRRNQLEDYYGYVSLAVWNFNQAGKPNEGIAFLQKTMKEVPPINIAQKVDLYEGFGNCYVALKQYGKAEQYYLTMLKLYKQTSFNASFYSTNYQMTTDYIHYNQILGNFYVLIKEYKKAGIYFGKILELPKGTVRPITLSKINAMQFIVDSANGNYISAIRHFEIHKRLDDSLFNETKSRQIEEMQVKYEIANKDKDLQRKEKNIVVLTNKSLVQEVSLRKANLIRNIIIVSALLLLAFLYTVYRFKQKHNIQLRAQQREINNKNQRLEQLLAEQQKLLAQKEWLVREIHHRVKNNLQIVISLLNVQAGFLDNPSALQAIRESRERMQAIAIIHQKLYQPDTGTMINLKSYIHEMVLYLRDSFTGFEKILFQLDIDDMELDVSQAVPLGIILNEAITNAVKYAFPDGKKGRISITIHALNEQDILLKIKDNGQGFPVDFNLMNNNSLGIQLMKLFAEQLEGELVLHNDQGAEISMVIKRQNAIDPISSFAGIHAQEDVTV